MTLSRRFRILLLGSFLLAYGALLLEDHIKAQTILLLFQYVLMFLAAFDMRSAGSSAKRAIFTALPFVAIEFSAGLLNYARMRLSEAPPPEGIDLDRALLGYVFATILFLPLAILAGGLGGLLATRRLRRKRREGNPALG